jgi:hypothetical protein
MASITARGAGPVGERLAAVSPDARGRGRRGSGLPYSEFIRQVEAGNVKSVVVYPDRLLGEFKQPLADGHSRFVTLRVEAGLAESLARQGVAVAGGVQRTFLRDVLSWVLPAVIFFGIWMFLMRRITGKGGIGGGLMSIGKSKARVYVEARPAAAVTYRIAFGPRAGHKVSTLRGAMPREAVARQALCADIDWFSLHAAVRCDARERKRLERLCRYPHARRIRSCKPVACSRAAARNMPGMPRLACEATTTFECVPRQGLEGKGNNKMNVLPDRHSNRVMGSTRFLVLALVACAPHLALAAGFDRTLELQGVRFHVTCPNEGSINKLTIRATGLSKATKPIVVEIDGAVTGAEVEDLNADGYPEIYVYATSAGSGSYGSLIGYASNRNRSLSAIYLPPLEDHPDASKGYMGHDKFAVGEGTFVRRFPLYRVGDTNAKPTGGTRQIQYKLVAGEAGWVLRKDRSIDF